MWLHAVAYRAYRRPDPWSQPRLIGPDKLAKLNGLGEQHFPLLQIERDREATEGPILDTAVLRHFEAGSPIISQRQQLCQVRQTQKINMQIGTKGAKLELTATR